eukprot:gene1061-2077_t
MKVNSYEKAFLARDNIKKSQPVIIRQRSPLHNQAENKSDLIDMEPSQDTGQEIRKSKDGLTHERIHMPADYECNHDESSKVENFDRALSNIILTSQEWSHISTQKTSRANIHTQKEISSHLVSLNAALILNPTNLDNEKLSLVGLLDSHKIPPSEKEGNKALIRKAISILDQIRINELRNNILNHLSMLILVHADLLQLVMGRYRSFRSAHMPTTEQYKHCSRISVSSIISVALHGGVFRWLQLAAGVHFDHLIQDICCRAYLNIQKKMSSTQKLKLSRNSNVLYDLWDDIVSQYLQLQQKASLRLLEHCEVSYEKKQNVLKVFIKEKSPPSTSTSTSDGILETNGYNSSYMMGNTTESLTLLQQLHFESINASSSLEYKQTYCGLGMHYKPLHMDRPHTQNIHSNNNIHNNNNSTNITNAKIANNMKNSLSIIQGHDLNEMYTNIPHKHKKPNPMTSTTTTTTTHNNGNIDKNDNISLGEQKARRNREQDGKDVFDKYLLQKNEKTEDVQKKYLLLLKNSQKTKSNYPKSRRRNVVYTRDYFKNSGNNYNENNNREEGNISNEEHFPGHLSSSHSSSSSLGDLASVSVTVTSDDDEMMMKSIHDHRYAPDDDHYQIHGNGNGDSEDYDNNDNGNITNRSFRGMKLAGDNDNDSDTRYMEAHHQYRNNNEVDYDYDSASAPIKSPTNPLSLSSTSSTPNNTNTPKNNIHNTCAAVYRSNLKTPSSITSSNSNRHSVQRFTPNLKTRTRSETRSNTPPLHTTRSNTPPLHTSTNPHAQSQMTPISASTPTPTSVAMPAARSRSQSPSPSPPLPASRAPPRTDSVHVPSSASTSMSTPSTRNDSRIGGVSGASGGDLSGFNITYDGNDDNDDELDVTPSLFDSHPDNLLESMYSYRSSRDVPERRATDSTSSYKSNKYNNIIIIDDVATSTSTSKTPKPSKDMTNIELRALYDVQYDDEMLNNGNYNHPKSILKQNNFDTSNVNSENIHCYNKEFSENSQVKTNNKLTTATKTTSSRKPLQNLHENTLLSNRKNINTIVKTPVVSMKININNEVFKNESSSSLQSRMKDVNSFNHHTGTPGSTIAASTPTTAGNSTAATISVPSLVNLLPPQQKEVMMETNTEISPPTPPPTTMTPMKTSSSTSSAMKHAGSSQHRSRTNASTTPITTSTSSPQMSSTSSSSSSAASVARTPMSASHTRSPSSSSSSSASKRVHWEDDDEDNVDDISNRNNVASSAGNSISGVLKGKCPVDVDENENEIDHSSRGGRLSLCGMLDEESEQEQEQCHESRAGAGVGIEPVDDANNNNRSKQRNTMKYMDDDNSYDNNINNINITNINNSTTTSTTKENKREHKRTNETQYNKYDTMTEDARQYEFNYELYNPNDEDKLWCIPHIPYNTIITLLNQQELSCKEKYQHSSLLTSTSSSSPCSSSTTMSEITSQIQLAEKEISRRNIDMQISSDGIKKLSVDVLEVFKAVKKNVEEGYVRLNVRRDVLREIWKDVLLLEEENKKHHIDLKALCDIYHRNISLTEDLEKQIQIEYSRHIKLKKAQDEVQEAIAVVQHELDSSPDLQITIRQHQCINISSTFFKSTALWYSRRCALLNLYHRKQYETNLEYRKIKFLQMKIFRAWFKYARNVSLLQDPHVELQHIEIAKYHFLQTLLLNWRIVTNLYKKELECKMNNLILRSAQNTFDALLHMKNSAKMQRDYINNFNIYEDNDDYLNYIQSDDINHTHANTYESSTATKESHDVCDFFPVFPLLTTAESVEIQPDNHSHSTQYQYNMNYIDTDNDNDNDDAVVQYSQDTDVLISRCAAFGAGHEVHGHSNGNGNDRSASSSMTSDEGCGDGNGSGGGDGNGSGGGYYHNGDTGGAGGGDDDGDDDDDGNDDNGTNDNSSSSTSSSSSSFTTTTANSHDITVAKNTSTLPPTSATVITTSNVSNIRRLLYRWIQRSQKRRKLKKSYYSIAYKSSILSTRRMYHFMVNKRVKSLLQMRKDIQKRFDEMQEPELKLDRLKRSVHTTCLQRSQCQENIEKLTHQVTSLQNSNDSDNIKIISLEDEVRQLQLQQDKNAKELVDIIQKTNEVQIRLQNQNINTSTSSMDEVELQLQQIQKAPTAPSRDSILVQLQQIKLQRSKISQSRKQRQIQINERISSGKLVLDRWQSCIEELDMRITLQMEKREEMAKGLDQCYSLLKESSQRIQLESNGPTKEISDLDIIINDLKTKRIALQEKERELRRVLDSLRESSSVSNNYSTTQLSPSDMKLASTEMAGIDYSIRTQGSLVIAQENVKNIKIQSTQQLLRVLSDWDTIDKGQRTIRNIEANNTHSNSIYNSNNNSENSTNKNIQNENTSTSTSTSSSTGHINIMDVHAKSAVNRERNALWTGRATAINEQLTTATASGFHPTITTATGTGTTGTNGIAGGIITTESTCTVSKTPSESSSINSLSSKIMNRLLRPPTM